MLCSGVRRTHLPTSSQLGQHQLRRRTRPAPVAVREEVPALAWEVARELGSALGVQAHRGMALWQLLPVERQVARRPPVAQRQPRPVAGRQGMALWQLVQVERPSAAQG